MEWRVDFIMNTYGIVLAGICFFIIGIFHPIVIKAEYYFSSGIWPLFLAAGLLCLAASLFSRHLLTASILGIMGCSFLWSIKELKEQEKRVAKGWFPKNPKQKEKRCRTEISHTPKKIP